MSEQIPSSCPGVASDIAGKSDGCRGCPNQSACASGAANAGPDPDLHKIAKRLIGVKNIVLILSGKGGVGKSSVSASLAQMLAQDEKLTIGLLDIDICGPSQPQMMGLGSEQVHASAGGWEPVWVKENLAVMSCGFLLESPDDAVIWRGPKKNGLIKQFLRDVEWGELDYLLVDTPPGTSDEHLSIVQLLQSLSSLRGAVLVSTPQEAALLDVKKQIDFCRRLKLNILGIVENMSSFVCPKCHHSQHIFPPSTGGAQRLCEQQHLRLLGRLPLNPLLGRALDCGEMDDFLQRQHEYAEQTGQMSTTLSALQDFNKNVLQAVSNNLKA